MVIKTKKVLSRVRNLFVARKTLSVFAVLVFVVAFGFTAKNVFAVPSKVGLGATLTKISDGTPTFPPIDPNGNNGLVATLDTASYALDVNVNTLDTAPHSVTNLVIVGTLTTASTEVTWLLSSLPNYCNGSVSIDGKTITCNIPGPVNTGSALNITASWFAQGGVPNNTPVSAQFAFNATDPSPDDNPLPATSNSSSLTVVSSAASEYEVRKHSQNNTTIVRDGSGNPTHLDVRWAFQVEIKPTDPNQLKGTSTLNLGDLNIIDDLQAPLDATQLPFTSKGTLISCGPVTSGNVTAASSFSGPNMAAVENSGTWTCVQPGGQGTSIAINATGIDWSPRWFPGRWDFTNNFSFNDISNTSEQYNVPVGQNNRAQVATQEITIRYPYADVVALDQTAADKSLTLNTIRWCNEIDNLSVTGGPVGVDVAANNVACNSFVNETGLGNLVQKNFLSTRVASSPSEDIGLTQGTLGPSLNDDYVVPGQTFAVQNIISNGPSSVNAMGAVMCDSIENDQYTLQPNVAPSYALQPNQYNTTNYSWSHSNNVAGFPSFTSADILVEYANVGTFASNNAQRDVDCDNPAIVWQTDPTLVSGGYSGVNLVRSTLLKSLAPNQTLSVYFTVKANTGLPAGTILRNFWQFKRIAPGVSNVWARNPATCNLEANANIVATCFTNRGDRALIVDAVANISIRDTVSPLNGDLEANITAGQDWTYTLRSGMSSNVNTSVTDIKVFNVLPPGMFYKSSTVIPDLVVPDCNANVNPTCLTVPANRTNSGFTTIQWDRGNFNYVASGAAPYTNNTLFGTWNVTVGTGVFAPQASALGSYAWVMGNG